MPLSIISNCSIRTEVRTAVMPALLMGLWCERRLIACGESRDEDRAPPSARAMYRSGGVEGVTLDQSEKCGSRVLNKQFLSRRWNLPMFLPVVRLYQAPRRNFHMVCAPQRKSESQPPRAGYSIPAERARGCRPNPCSGTETKSAAGNFQSTRGELPL